MVTTLNSPNVRETTERERRAAARLRLDDPIEAGIWNNKYFRVGTELSGARTEPLRRDDA
jgi:hypothetical protein